MEFVRLLALFTIVSALAATSASAWDYVREGTGGLAVLVHPSGDVISAGSQGDPHAGLHEGVAVRHDARTGAEKWRYRFSQGGSGTKSVVLVHAPGDSLFIVSMQGGRYGGDSADVLRLDAAGGQMQWSIHLDETALASAAVDPLGELVVAGATSGPDGVYGDQDFLVIKFSGSTGAELWRSVTDGSLQNDDRAQAVAVTEQGDVFVGGFLGDDPVLNFPDFSLLKLSGNDGSEQWRSGVPSLEAHGGEVRSLAIDSAGDVVAAGAASLGGWCDFVVAKFAHGDGHEIWRHVENFSCDFASAVATDPSDNVLVTGALSSFSTLKLSGQTGTLVWRHDLPVPPGCTGHAGECTAGQRLRVLANGNAVVAGSGPEGSVNEIVVVELDASSGAALWSHRSHHPDSCGDGGWGGMGLDASPDGNVAVAGNYWAQVDGVCTWPPVMRYVAKRIAPDVDGDDVDADDDNCLVASNPLQLDSDSDGFGDACDADYDNTGRVTIGDLQHFRSVFELSRGDPGFDPAADHDNSGAIMLNDLQVLRRSFSSAPGPSALACAGTVPCFKPDL